MKPQPTEARPGQESVWDYPRPPRIEETGKHIQVIFNDVVIADTRRALRVLETSQAPAYYIPPQDVRMEYLQDGRRRTWCEWKGRARYYTVVVDDRRAENAAWYYPQPTPAFESIQDYVAFYCEPMDRCLVDGEVARPMPSAFYGGWITDDIVGPFKGGPGSEGW